MVGMSQTQSSTSILTGTDPDLINNGPIVTVRVRATGQHDGSIAEVQALIDTGASISSVHPSVMAKLQAQVVGRFDFKYADTSFPACPIHLVDMHFPNGMSMNALPVMAFMPSGRIMALLGRDVLDACRLIYDGPAKRWSLECVKIDGAVPAEQPVEPTLQVVSIPGDIAAVRMVDLPGVARTGSAEQAAVAPVECIRANPKDAVAEAMEKGIPVCSDHYRDAACSIKAGV